MRGWKSFIGDSYDDRRSERNTAVEAGEDAAGGGAEEKRVGEGLLWDCWGDV